MALSHIRGAHTALPRLGRKNRIEGAFCCLEKWKLLNLSSRMYRKTKRYISINILEIIIFNFSVSTNFILLTFKYAQFSLINNNNKQQTTKLSPTPSTTLFPTLLWTSLFQLLSTSYLSLTPLHTPIWLLPTPPHQTTLIKVTITYPLGASKGPWAILGLWRAQFENYHTQAWLHILWGSHIICGDPCKVKMWVLCLKAGREFFSFFSVVFL